MIPFELKDNIHWVGTVDWEARDFHGYALSPFGTTYNAFVIKDEKTTLFDTVKSNTKGRFFCNLAHVVGDMEKIDYIVVNHLEPDHSGCLVEAVQRIKPEKIFCSPMGEKSMKALFPESADWPVQVVPSGSSISLGKHTCQFLETRMLHWPDNMATYIPEAKVLISSDAFGQNWATSERYADQVDRGRLLALLKEYFANIVQPYSPTVIKTLDKLGSMNLDIDMIVPDHGLIYRGDDCAWVLKEYREFSRQIPQLRALLVYDTMWHATEKMIHAVADGLVESGVPVRISHVKVDHHSRIMTELLDCGGLVLGSPTHNNGILPMMAGVLRYMKGLKPLNKVAGAVGSYGWSGESVKVLAEAAKDMNMDFVEDGIKHQYTPGHEVLKACKDYGKTMADALKAKIEAVGK